MSDAGRVLTYERALTDARRALAITEAYEWAIGVVESLPHDEALTALRHVAAANRRVYEDELDFARIARVLGPAVSADARVVPTVEPGRVT